MSEPGRPGRRVRHDWRFVVPRSCLGGTAVVVGDDDGTGVAALVDSGLVAHVGTETDPPSRPPDLVVRLRPAAGRPWRELEPLVGPDTVVVLEEPGRRWPDRRARGSRRDRAEVRYLAVPSHEHSRWIAPVDDGRALRWYLANRFIPATCAVAALTGLARFLSRVGGTGLLGLVVDSIRVVGPPDRLTSPIAAGGARDGAVLVFGSSQDAGSRVAAIRFDDRAGPPTHLVKLSAGPGVNERTAEEVARTREVAETASSAGLADTVPEITGAGTIGNLAWVEQTLLGGQSAERVLGASGTDDGAAIGVLERVAEWSRGMAAAGPRDVWTAERVRDEVIGAVRAAGAGAIDRSRLEQAAARAAVWSPPDIPVTTAHFDLAPCNVMLAPGRTIGVVDWELPARGFGADGSTRSVAPLGHDLAFFAAYWAFQRSGCASIEDEVAVVDAMLADASHPAAAALRRFHALTGGDERRIGTVWVLLWAQRLRAADARASTAPSASADRDRQVSFRLLERTLSVVSPD